MKGYSTLKREFTLLSFLLVCSFIISTYVFWIYELGKGSIQHVTDIFWWWIVTSSTVGYGEIIPTTAAGRAAGVLVIIIGIYAYTHVISLILRAVQYKFEEEERGYAPVQCEGHLLICEYTAYSDELIQEIKARDLFTDRDIVITSALVERTPYEEYNFVYGEPISPDTLKRANAEKADYIFVFSNNRFTDPDAKTLHIVSRIMHINTRAKIFVELHDPENPLLQHLPREVTIMQTSDLLSNSLSHNYVNIDRYLE